MQAKMAQYANPFRLRSRRRKRISITFAGKREGGVGEDEPRDEMGTSDRGESESELASQDT